MVYAAIELDLDTVFWAVVAFQIGGGGVCGAELRV
jgi:hypothetical protein